VSCNNSSLYGLELGVKAHELLVNEGDDKVPDLVVDGNAELHPSQYEPVLQFPATRAIPFNFKYTNGTLNDMKKVHC
jgi:hypothetical protein